MLIRCPATITIGGHSARCIWWTDHHDSTEHRAEYDTFDAVWNADEDDITSNGLPAQGGL